MDSSAPPTLTADRLRALRLRGQWLDRPRPAEAAAVVRELGGVQAQDSGAAGWSIGVRAAGLTLAEVTRARLEDRSLVRTWAMRGTLHLLAAEDVSWLLPLLAPGLIAGNARRYAQLGLDAETLAGGVRALGETLAEHGPLTRAEIVEHLGRRGIRLDGQARPYLIQRAALEGLICYGPERGPARAEPSYVLLSDWLPSGHRTPGRATLPREAAVVELARRYLAAFGPAATADVAAWSGLPAAELRRAWTDLEPELERAQTADGPTWCLRARHAWLDEPPAAQPAWPNVRLLPAFDTYLLGYRRRDLTVPQAHARRVNAGGGMIRPVLLVDGQALGTWETRRRQGRLEVSVEPFEDELPPAVRPPLEAEIERLAAFLGA